MSREIFLPKKRVVQSPATVFYVPKHTTFSGVNKVLHLMQSGAYLLFDVGLSRLASKYDMVRDNSSIRIHSHGSVAMPAPPHVWVKGDWRDVVDFVEISSRV